MEEMTLRRRSVRGVERIFFVCTTGIAGAWIMTSQQKHWHF